MDEFLFKMVMGGVTVPLKPWPQKFYISRTMLNMGQVEVRPLTFTGLVKGVMTNFITMSYWRFMYLLFLIGFLDVGAEDLLSWKRWKWNFWKVRKRRKEEKERLKKRCATGVSWRARSSEEQK